MKFLQLAISHSSDNWNLAAVLALAGGTKSLITKTEKPGFVFGSVELGSAQPDLLTNIVDRERRYVRETHC